MRRPGITSLFFAGALVVQGCVHIPGNDQLVLSRGGDVVRMGDAECGRGWQRAPKRSEEPSALDPAGFRLMIWNVFKARAEDWSEDFARLSADQDLILLQEAHLTPQFRTALRATGYHWTMARAFDFNGAETGVLTAGRVSPSAACLSRATEPLLGIPKSVLLTVFPLPGTRDELWVANIHGVNFTLGTSRFEAQLASLARVLRSHSGPLVLAGDFNNWSRERGEILHAITDSLELRPVVLARDERSRHLGYPVDFVFYRGIQVLDADSTRVSSSDHNPIRVKFRVSEPIRKGDNR